jgi:hypothetical protein
MNSISGRAPAGSSAGKVGDKHRGTLEQADNNEIARGRARNLRGERIEPISAAVNRTRISLKAIFAGGNRVLAPFDLPFYQTAVIVAQLPVGRRAQGGRMLYSTEQIMSTHARSLPRPADLRDMVVAKANCQAHDAARTRRAAQNRGGRCRAPSGGMRHRLRQ